MILLCRVANQHTMIVQLGFLTSVIEYKRIAHPLDQHPLDKHHLDRALLDQIQMDQTITWTRPSFGPGHQLDQIQLDQTYSWTRPSFGPGHQLDKGITWTRSQTQTLAKCPGKSKYEIHATNMILVDLGI